MVQQEPESCRFIRQIGQIFFWTLDRRRSQFITLERDCFLQREMRKGPAIGILQFDPQATAAFCAEIQQALSSLKSLRWGDDFTGFPLQN